MHATLSSQLPAHLADPSRPVPGPYESAPMLVNMALSVELFLKALALQLGLGIKKTHNLKALWKKIPEEYRTRAREFFAQAKTELPKTSMAHLNVTIDGLEPRKAASIEIDQVIEDHCETFVCWRYLEKLLSGSSQTDLAGLTCASRAIERTCRSVQENNTVRYTIS